MVTALPALPALLLLFGFPHFGWKSNRPVSPSDSLPPAWKSASRLALEDEFVTGRLDGLRLRGPSLRLSQDPRVLRITVDPDSGTISTAPRLGDIPVGPPAARPLSAFSRETGRTTFERLWRERSRRDINVRGQGTGTAAQTQGFSFRIPSPLPARVQSLLGPGGPALNVSGSENIRLSGTSQWGNQQLTAIGQRRSLFPTLNMQQDLDIRLEGQLSDRIKVNLLQNSMNQIPLANRIAINYRGGEDDLVQALDLGNTNLTLPGTQYVSYSGRNEGLFGVKTALRYGPLDLTVLASKQEGKSERASYSGGASKQSQTLPDYDYVRGVYFFLYDPDTPTRDIDDASIVVYRDNADYAANSGNWVRGRAMLEPPIVPGGAAPDTTTPAVLGQFTQLTAGADKDYDVLRDVYGPYFKVIRLHRQLTGQQRLAVTYRYRAAGSSGDYVQLGSPPGPDGAATNDPDGVPTWYMKLLRAPADSLHYDPADPTRFDADLARSPLNATRRLELKNFYQLSGQKLDPSTVKIRIRQTMDEPARYTVSGATQPVPYIEVLGLDNMDETVSPPDRTKHDGLVDGTVQNAGALPRGFVDYDNGVLFLPDPRPFAPDLNGPFGAAVSRLLSRRDSLVGPPVAVPVVSNRATIAPNATNPTIYDAYNQNEATRTQASTYFIEIEFTAQQAQGTIQLGNGQLLEGSEVVTVGGETWQRDKDYDIDYDLGRLTLKRNPPPGAQVNVNYSYAPLFQQAGRTLVGSAFRLEGREKSFGGAFMYESKGAQDLRPRIGEEPSRSLITDLNTEWTFHPDWLTRLVDRLPNVRTTAPSLFHVQAEVGMSMPNPNTKNEVYIDDMEGVRDAVSLSLTQERWHWSGAPIVNGLPITDPVVAQNYGGPYGIHDAEIHWYSPPGYVQESDLKPNMQEGQGAKNPHQVLCLTVPRRPRDAAGDSTRLWAGIEYTLDPFGLDLSRSQFIELWVNDFRDQHGGAARDMIRGRHVKLHLDLGTTSEDQMRSPDQPPNGALDTEDKALDRQLTLDEDTGLDGRMDGSEPAATPDLVTVTTTDLAGDDFKQPTDVDKKENSIDPTRWRNVNGTEGNHEGGVMPLPDTEDQDQNGALGQSNDYLEYTIDLGDDTPQAPYLVTDVWREFGPESGTNPPYPPQNNGLYVNGWRRYRIPIADTLARRIGNPNLALVQRVRVWLDGMVETEASEGDGIVRKPLLMIGGLDIVGNRWLQAQLDSTALAAPLTTFTLNSVNTVDNGDVYAPPFDPGETRNGSQAITRREQSLSLEFTDLKPGGTLEAYKTFSLAEDYSRYGDLHWYVTAFGLRDTTGAVMTEPDSGLSYFVRFASDQQGRNYYEYRSPLPISSSLRWNEVLLELTRISNLKLAPNFPKADPIAFDTLLGGAHYVVNGRPSFTRLFRISVGLVNQGTRRVSSGQLWFDELIAKNIQKKVDRAQRVQVDGQIANLASYNLAWSGRGADFLTVGESRGTGSSQDNLSFNTVLQPQRFFEQTRISLPVSLGYSRNSAMPLFSAGDDIRRTGPLQAASESRSVSRTFSTSYSRAWSDRSNPFLRYTLGGIVANFSQSTNTSRGPVDSSMTSVRAASVNYGIAPRRLLSFGMPLGKARFYPLPERVFWNYSTSTTESRAWDRVGDLRDQFRERTNVRGRAAYVDFGADSRPFDLFHHHIEAHRNLMLPDSDVRNERLGFVNLGRVTSWRQNMDARYAVPSGWLKPVFTWSAGYAQNNGPELSRNLSLRSVSNGQSLGMTLEIPLDRLDDAVPPPAGPRARAHADSLAGPRDSLRAAPRPRGGPRLPWRSLLAAFGNIRTDVGYSRTSAFSRLTGTPSFGYLFGFTSRLDSVRTPPGFGNDANFGNDLRAGAQTNVRLPFLAHAATRMDFTQRQVTSNNLRNRNWNLRFPDVDLDYGRLATVLRLDRLLTGPQIRTAFGRTITAEYANNHDSPTSKATSSEWRPLLGVSGTMRNGTRMDFKLERRITERENLLSGHSVTTDRLTTADFSLSRSYSQGQKVNLLGRTKTVSSNISLQLSGKWELHSGETIAYADETRARPVGDPKFPIKDSRLSLNGTGSYSFSTNVTGNLSLGYLQTSDRNKVSRKEMRVELRAQFSF